jgi:formiminotetrahydrofolate cyclodeaminase
MSTYQPIRALRGTQLSSKGWHQEAAETLQTASLLPMKAAEEAAGLLKLLRKLEPVSNPNLKSDLQTALAMARAAIDGALANVGINLQSIKDEAFTAALSSRMKDVKTSLV